MFNYLTGRICLPRTPPQKKGEGRKKKKTSNQVSELDSLLANFFFQKDFDSGAKDQKMKPALSLSVTISLYKGTEVVTAPA